jgi:hypothetical protein
MVKTLKLSGAKSKLHAMDELAVTSGLIRVRYYRVKKHSRILYQRQISNGRSVWAILWGNEIKWITSTEKAPKYQDVKNAIICKASTHQTLGAFYGTKCVRCRITNIGKAKTRNVQDLFICFLGIGTKKKRRWPTSRTQWRKIYLTVYSMTLDNANTKQLNFK